MGKKKKIVISTTAAALILALGMAGTFAWSGGEDSDGNIDGNVSPAVKLHDDNDFDDTETVNGVRNRDIYVENIGDTKVYVRVRLDEFLTIGGKSLIGGAVRNDKSTWKTHAYKGAGSGLCGEDFHDYFTWQMGNANPVSYKSNVKNYYTDTTVTRDKQTQTAAIVTMEQFVNADKKPEQCWVIDTDGYAYWYTQLDKTEATGLLLDSITNLGEIDDSYYYGVNAKLEAVTESDLNSWINVTQSNAVRATVNGVRFLKDLSPNYIKITPAMNAAEPYAKDFDGDNDGYLTRSENRQYIKESGTVAVNETNFPDAGLRAKVQKDLDLDQSGSLTPDEIAAATSLDVSNQGITDLQGLEKLTKLTTLDVSGNKLTRLDLSKNPEVTSVKGENQTPEPVILTYNAESGAYESKADMFLPGTAFTNGGNVDADVKADENGKAVVTNYTAEKTEGFSVSLTKAKSGIGTLSGTVLLRAEIDVNEANFPDAAVRSAVSAAADTDKDGKLTSPELLACKTLNLSKTGVKDLTGLEVFPNLTALDISNNGLKSVDLSSTPYLESLKAADNEIASIDFTKVSNLTTLDWSRNKRAVMDVGGASKLTTLDVSGNALSKLDLSKNTELTALTGNNQSVSAEVVYDAASAQYKSEAGTFQNGTTSTSSDVTFDAAGAVSVAGYAAGKTSDFTTALSVGSLSGTVSYSGIIEVKVANFPDKELRDYISVTVDKDSDGKLNDTEAGAFTTATLSGKNISDMTGLQLFPKLTTLNYTGSSLATIDLSKTTRLTTLNVSNNQFRTIDLSKAPMLTTLNISNNYLTNLDLSGNSALTSVMATGQNVAAAVTYDTSITKYRGSAGEFAAGTTFGNAAVTVDPLSGAVLVPSSVGTDTYSRTINYGSGKSAVVTGTVSYTKNGSLKASVAATAVDTLINIGGQEWYVLTNNGTTAELLTKDSVENRVFHSTTPYPTWGKSEIRTYLNGTYLNSLSADLKSAIKPMNLTTATDFTWGSTETTTDSVYLLSLKSKAEDTIVLTATGREIPEYTNVLVSLTRQNWWLRSPGTEYDSASSCVLWDGNIYPDGNANSDGVRPALTLKLQ